MNNYINYYYQLYPLHIHYKPPFFYFDFKQAKYYFFRYERPLAEIEALYNLNQTLLEQKIPVHTIILNKEGNPLTYVEEIPYLLLRTNIEFNNKITLDLINNFHLYNLYFPLDPLLIRTNWGQLWSAKIDYIEYQFSHIGKKYPLIRGCINYFIGLGENAIMYVNNTKRDFPNHNYEQIIVAHKRLKTDDTLFDFYNPLNLILDYKVRDCAEYIKTAFFQKTNIWSELQSYFNQHQFSAYHLRLLYARLLYPSSFFDQYELVITEQDDPESLNKILEQAKAYEIFLNAFYEFININGDIPPLEWLNRPDY